MLNRSRTVVAAKIAVPTARDTFNIPCTIGVGPAFCGATIVTVQYVEEDYAIWDFVLVRDGV